MKVSRRLSAALVLAVLTCLTVTSTAEARPRVVRKTVRLHQRKLANATKLRFKVWQKEDNIDILAGEVKVKGVPPGNITMTRGSQPPRWNAVDNGLHAYDVVVTFPPPGIPRCTRVKITIKLRLTAWNTIRIWKPTWGRSAPPGAETSFGWFLEPPEPVPGNPDLWSHRFVLGHDGREPIFHVDSYLAYYDGAPPDSSWWCGVVDTSYAGGDGYGNDWDERLDVPPVDWTGYMYPVITFMYRNDTEPAYDYSYVEAESADVFVRLSRGYDGVHPWSAAGFYIGLHDNPLVCRFRVVSDLMWSDADNLFNSDGGAFHVDEIKVWDYYTGHVLFSDDVEAGSPCEPSCPLSAPVDLKSVKASVRFEPLSGDTLDWFDEWDLSLADSVRMLPGDSLALTVVGPAAAPDDSVHVYAYYEIWEEPEPGPQPGPLLRAWLDHYDWLVPVSPVEAAFYTTATGATAVTLGWTIASTADIDGFNVYRSTSPDGPFARVNEELIEPASPGEYEDTSVWPETTFWYQLKAVLSDGSEDVVGSALAQATTGGKLVARLYPASPNPFTGSTQVRFDVPDPVGPVNLAIYDVTGRLVKTLIRTPMDRGRHTVEWDGTDDAGHRTSSGVYFMRFEAGRETKSGKITLTR